MSDHKIHLSHSQPIILSREHVAEQPTKARRFGEILVEMGAIDAQTLLKALVLQRRENAPLGDIMLAHGMITEAQRLHALSKQFGLGIVDETNATRSFALARTLPHDLALKWSAIPWLRSGQLLMLATSNPCAAKDIRAYYATQNQDILIALASENLILEQQQLAYGTQLVREAEALVPLEESCRNWRWPSLVLSCLLTVLFLCFALWPSFVFMGVLVTAFGALIANTALKMAALYVHRRPAIREKRSDFDTKAQHKLPKISLFVPMFDEPNIALPLMARLSKLTYPKELLEVCLLIEACDHTTRQALKQVALPSHFKTLIIPEGHPQTKPRAMNYALSFAKGEIIGIYDAEDAPDPNQLHKVAARFNEAPSTVACLQGRLDFYNAKHNWVARCFTIEYASWFRLMLPSMEKLGMVIPLGGTTLFFKTDTLKSLGGWDAHNVTEDADLGLRLARHGYKTEIIDVTTMEEANSAVMPWIKQRSRWMKGYVMTWIVHNRRPFMLLKNLGFSRWLGFQIMFLGSLLNAALAPSLWALGIMLSLGGTETLAQQSPWLWWSAAATMLVATLVTLAMGFVACRKAHLKHLASWVPATLIYYQLGTLALAKALWEVITAPYFWDKTDHGQFGGSHHLPNANEPPPP